MPDHPEPAPLPAQKRGWFLASPARRRPLLLACLVGGLAVFLVWLPPQARGAVWSALVAHRALVALLFLFVLVALSLVWSAGQRLDSTAFLFLNRGQYHPAWLDGVMWLATQLGSMPLAFVVAGLLLALQYRGLALILALGTITLWLLVESLKLLTDRARPFLVLEGTRIIGRPQSGRSFPSGHTSQVFFMMTLLSHQLPVDAWQSLGLYGVAALVGFTRVYVGAHYPRDVLGGAILGSVWGVLALLVLPYWIGPH